MFIRLTPIKNALNNTTPSSLFINLDEISRVEEVRSRPGADIELLIRIFMKDGNRQDLNDQAYSAATIKTFLKHLDSQCLNPKDEKAEEKAPDKKAAAA